MAGAGPTVTLTFAGDTSKLEKSFDSVGSSAKGMSTEVGKTSSSLQKSGQRLDGFSGKADAADQRAMGFRDAVTGVSDTLRAFNDPALSTEQRLLFLGMGMGDLASSIVNLAIPAVKGLIGFLRGGLATALTFIAAHPIAIALIGLAAIFVFLWTQSETFRDIVLAVFNAIGAAFSWLYANLIQPIGAAIGSVFSLIGRSLSVLYENVVLPVAGLIGSAFSAVGTGLQWVFNNFISPIFGFIGAMWSSVGSIIDGIWVDVIEPVFGFIGSALEGVESVIDTLVTDLLNLKSESAAVHDAFVTSSGGANLLNISPGLATGGPAQAGQSYIVGEEGPELFVPNHSGTVIPNDAIMGGSGRPALSAAGGSGGGPMALTFRGNTDSAVATLIMRLIRSGAIQLGRA